jgi:hypothetical protein
MPRPKANPDQQLRAYQLWRVGLGPSAIEEKLAEEFEKTVSDRTIALWVKGFKALNPETVNLDAPFEWCRMHKYGLPWEASSFFMGMLAIGISKKTWLAELGRGNVVSFTPTVREAIWWWRVHQAAPEISERVGTLWDIQALAARFVYREMALELLAVPMDTEDLEACLVLKPWLDVKHHNNYHKAVKLGVVPPLKVTSPDQTGAAIRASAERPVELMGWLMESGGGYLRVHSELLLTQQRDIAEANPELFQLDQLPSEDEVNKILQAPKQEE